MSAGVITGSRNWVAAWLLPRRDAWKRRCRRPAPNIFSVKPIPRRLRENETGKPSICCCARTDSGCSRVRFLYGPTECREDACSEPSEDESTHGWDHVQEYPGAH